MRKALNQLFKNMTKKRKNKISNFDEAFFKNPHHQWINNDPQMKKVFNILLSTFPEEVSHFFDKKQNVIFTQNSGNWACAVNQIKNNHIILIYPDLYKVLTSARFTQGIAILAHELGHIFMNHGEKQLSTLLSQIEADMFALTLGFGEDLIMFLNDFKNNEECMIRREKLQKKLKVEASYLLTP